jgi:hypothetical protein
VTGKVKLRRWAYGYIRPNAKGQGVYVIDKRIGGIHFHISTRRTSEHAAIREYERFEFDPHGYHPGGQGADAVHITAELTEEFALWMRDAKRDSREWIRSVVRFLGDWAEALGRKDLRSLNVQRDLKPPLKKWKSQRQRVEAIKSFCTWLRTEKGLLSKGNDATQDLRIPPATAEKLRRRKVVAEEDIRRVLPLLPDETRDVLILQLGTAWHISEVRRFAANGEILPLVGGKLLAALTVKHKSGEIVSQAVVTPEHLEAARRIRTRGGAVRASPEFRHDEALLYRPCGAIRHRTGA